MPLNSGAISVHLPGAHVVGKQAKWRLTEIPHGFSLLGDVVRGDGSGGHLVRSDQSGRFMCWDGLTLSELPQDRTRAAIAAVMPHKLQETRPPKPLPLRAAASMTAVIQAAASRSRRWHNT